MADKNEFDFNTQIDYKYPTSSKTSPNRKKTNADYEGVEYISSGKTPIGKGLAKNPEQPAAVKPATATSGRTAGGASGAPPAKGGGKKPKMRLDSQSNLFLIAAVGVGLLICLGAFLLMFNLTKPKVVKQPDPTEIGTDANSTTTENDAVPLKEPPASENSTVAESDVRLFGAVVSISREAMAVLNEEDNTIREIYLDSYTKFKDKYGQSTTWEDVNIGDCVGVDYNSTLNKATIVQGDSEAWKKTSVKNQTITHDTESIKVDGETYLIPKSVIVLPEGSMLNIKPSDVLTLRGRKNKVLSINIEKRSGVLAFKNKERITNATVEVDADVYKALDEVNTLNLSEGPHTVVIKGDNIDAFSRDIIISPGETNTLDLAEVSLKSGTISLKVNETDYSLSVNNEPVADNSKPLTLPFGTYKLKITKDGFTPWEDTVIVNSANVAVSAELQKIVKTGKITITTLPDGVGGSVYIGNAMVGTAPVTVNIAYGTHQLTVTQEGYQDSVNSIIVDGDARFEVVLHKKQASDTGSTGTTDTEPAATNEEPPAVDSDAD